VPASEAATEGAKGRKQAIEGLRVEGEQEQVANGV
jgi:hypothetical protein